MPFTIRLVSSSRIGIDSNVLRRPRASEAHGGKPRHTASHFCGNLAISRQVISALREASS
jgi:hypothetical protein